MKSDSKKWYQLVSVKCKSFKGELFIEVGKKYKSCS